MPSSAGTQKQATCSSAAAEPRQRGPLGERLADAELTPIRVHTEGGVWRVDYGSYIQGTHADREDAIEAAMTAAVWENREVTIARPRPISETARPTDPYRWLAGG